MLIFREGSHSPKLPWRMLVSFKVKKPHCFIFNILSVLWIPFNQHEHMGVEPKIGGKTPKWMVKIMENPTF